MSPQTQKPDHKSGHKDHQQSQSNPTQKSGQKQQGDKQTEKK